MKKREMIELFRQSVDTKPLTRLYLNYDAYETYWFPLGASEKLFYVLKEDDFIINGFSIRRFCDLKKIEIKDDKKYNDILKAEKIFDGVIVPDIDLTNWHSVFMSLYRIGNNIIIEHESLIEEEWEYYIGKIEKVLKTKVLFRHFDAEGNWQDEFYEIPFSRITSVTFDSRYVNVFSKYV